MIDLILQWMALTVIVFFTAVIVPGVHIRDFKAAFLVSLIFGILSWGLGSALFVMIGVGTLGIGFVLAFVTRWVVMAILLKFTDALTDKLNIDSFARALLAALVISVLSVVADSVFRGLSW